MPRNFLIPLQSPGYRQGVPGSRVGRLDGRQDDAALPAPWKDS